MKAIKKRYILISLIIGICVTGFCLEVFYSPEGIVGTLYPIAILAEFAFLILGPILFVFRISGFLRRENFAYIFVAVSNVWLSLLSFILYFSDRVQAKMIWAFLPNLFLGILLLTDIYWLRNKNANTQR